MTPPSLPTTKPRWVAFVLLALLASGCGSDSDSTDVVTEQTATTAVEQELEPEKVPEETIDEIRRFWIKPDVVDCVGEAPQRCLQVAESEDGEYLLFYDPIAGFEFVEGTSYVIDVLVEDVFDPPADASSLSYTLVEVISAD